jgi:hypothetical protein
MVAHTAAPRAAAGEIAASEEGEVARSVFGVTEKLGVKVALVKPDASYLFDGPCEA